MVREDSVGTRAWAGLEGCVEVTSWSRCGWRSRSTGREEGGTQAWSRTVRDSNKLWLSSTGEEQWEIGKVRIQRLLNTRPVTGKHGITVNGKWLGAVWWEGFL